MRHQRRRHRRLLRPAFLVVLVPLVLALALPALALADEPSYVVQNAATSCLNPDVSGDLVVWEDYAGNQDIWAKLAGGSAFPIVQLSGSVQQTPAVDGTTVVWADDRASAAVYKIYGATVDPSNGTATAFPISTTAGVKSDPDVSGRYVVWVNYVGATNTYDIYGYDLVTATEFPICTNSAKQIAPAISGDLVVWQDYRNNTTYADIYAARISAPGHGISEFAVCAQPSAPMHLDATPAVQGNTIAWLDGRGGGNARIYAATVSGTSVLSEWQVSTTITRSCSNPAVNGTLIAWTYSGGTTNDDIYGCRIGGAEFPIASTSQYESSAAVTSSHTVWTNRTTWDIYGADIGGFGWSTGISVNAGADFTTSRSVALNLSATSSVGVATHMSFSANGVDWTEWEPYAASKAWMLAAGDGVQRVYVRYRDAEANVSPVKSDGILLDENAPSTDDDAPEGWTTGDVSVTLTAGDGGGTGVIGTVYDLDGAGNVSYTGPITVSGDGMHTLVYRSADAAGFAEDPQTVQVWIDGSSPQTTDNAGEGWHASGFDLVLDGYDAVWLDRTEYSLDGVTWVSGTGRRFAVGAKRGGTSATFTVRYRSVDAAGNVEETRTCFVRIDGRPPVTTNDYDGLAHGADVTVGFEAFDAHSGVKETWYSVDGSDWTMGTAALVPAPSDGSGDGPHVVSYYSVDNAGLTETVRTVTVVIDAVP